MQANSVQKEENTEFLEIESKYKADNIDRLKFKEIARNLKEKEFLYIESTDVYYIKSEDEFLRYRMSAENTSSKRAELTFKKKHKNTNNIVRTEVNMRVDHNKPEVIATFCEGLGYQRNFSIFKICDIYKYEDATLVYYSVRDEDGKYASFIEVEVTEGFPKTQEEGLEILRKYEKIIEPLGITPQNRLRKSLYEMYRKEFK